MPNYFRKIKKIVETKVCAVSVAGRDEPMVFEANNDQDFETKCSSWLDGVKAALGNDIVSVDYHTTAKVYEMDTNTFFKYATEVTNN